MQDVPPSFIGALTSHNGKSAMNSRVMKSSPFCICGQELRTILYLFVCITMFVWFADRLCEFPHGATASPDRPKVLAQMKPVVAGGRNGPHAAALCVPRHRTPPPSIEGRREGGRGGGTTSSARLHWPHQETPGSWPVHPVCRLSPGFRLVSRSHQEVPGSRPGNRRRPHRP